MIGSAIAKDLSANYILTVADSNKDNLRSLEGLDNITPVVSDVTSKPELEELIENSDLVVGALPSKIGFSVLKDVISLGKDIVDISFFNENPFELTDLALNNKVTAVIDCGVAPGLSNIILGFHSTQMKVEKYKCCVGGLPKNPKPPFYYKAPFSPIDVIEEYTRPARLIENGEIVIKEPLTENELIKFKETGELEAFLTDGLRTLLSTLDIKYMIEKTIRYPAHLEYVQSLKQKKGWSLKDINLDELKLQPGEEEFTVMRLEIKGNEAGKERKLVYDLYDEYDKTTNTTSMARTTGFTCCAVADLILKEKFNRKGLIPPEIIGTEPGCKDEVLWYLAERGIEFEIH